MLATDLLKRLLPRDLLGRTSLIIILPMVIVQGILAIVFWENHWDRITGRLVGNFVNGILAVNEALRVTPAHEARLLFAMAARMEFEVQITPGAVLPPNLPRPEHSSTERELVDILSRQLNRPFYATLSGPPSREIQIIIEEDYGLVHYQARRKLIDSSTTTVFTLWMMGTSVLVLAAALVFMRNQIRPIRRLAAAADSFGKGRDVPDFKPEGAREVRQAAAAFQKMRARISRYVTQRTEMLAGISHDLRTPLTRMKLQLAMMGEADGAADLKDDVDEMERMVEGYLAFARGEGGESVEDAVDLGALLEDVIARCRREGGAPVTLDCEEDLLLPLRPHAFARCLTNLVSNAIRYGGHVAVRAGRHRETVEITIDDDGPGIPATQRDEVFKPFVRLEGSRNPKTGGIGLGLTIARDLVRAHGGEIWLEDSPIGGLRVRVRLPL